MLGWRRPIAFDNGRILTPDGVVPSMRVGARVLDVDVRPRSGDHVVDLDGAFVLPGLINAHDHLELNHYGLLKRRSQYANATEWIDDLRPALQDDASIRRNSAFPLADRLFVGGLKNALAGVTTVAHHNPLYPELRQHVPIRVVRRFGWAHSVALQDQPVGAHGEPGGDVRERCRVTPRDRPFILHAAEGIDAGAAAELTTLEEWGCLRDNTVLVHAVAMTASAWGRVLDRQTSVVWCPASNRFLFGCTLPARALLDAAPQAWRHVCLGTDSRVTGSRDLLDELREARSMRISPDELLRMVTVVAARVLRLREVGELRPGAHADLLVIPDAKGLRQRSATDAAAALLASRRADLSLVMVGGRPIVASPAYRGIFRARRTNAHAVRVDEAERFLAADIAQRLTRCPIAEPGVTTVQ